VARKRRKEKPRKKEKAENAKRNNCEQVQLKEKAGQSTASMSGSVRERKHARKEGGKNSAVETSSAVPPNAVQTVVERRVSKVKNFGEEGFEKKDMPESRAKKLISFPYRISGLEVEKSRVRKEKE